MLLSLVIMVVVVAYSTWSWRVALAERRRDLLAAEASTPGAGAAAPRDPEPRGS
jgi:hypothetical protein